MVKNDNFMKYSVGLEDMFNSMFNTKEQTYPPYNIIKSKSIKETENVAENVYFIELAVAGFDREDLHVEVHKNVLSIKGSVKNDKTEYIHRGIAARSFERKFSLSPTIVVDGVFLKLGLLTIKLKEKVPEEERPKRLAISSW